MRKNKSKHQKKLVPGAGPARLPNGFLLRFPDFFPDRINPEKSGRIRSSSELLIRNPDQEKWEKNNPKHQKKVNEIKKNSEFK